jgi:hypothetical protein
MGCFGSTDTWKADGMLLTLNFYIMSLIKKQMTTKGINHY